MYDTKLDTLLTLIRTGSYTRAGEELSLTQPAVSHHIRQLEQEYAVKIFYKDKKELKLTPEGEILAKYARRMIALSNTARQALRDAKRQVKRLNVGITPTMMENLLPQVLATYCDRNEGVRINIFTDTINNIYEKLKAFELDLAIVEGKINDPRFVCVLLDTDYLCLVVSPKHRLAGRSSVDLSELRNEKFILRAPGAGTRRMFENYLGSRSESLDDYKVLIQVDNVNSIKELVALNMGVSVVAHSACLEEELTGRLSVVPIKNAGMMREINMVHHRDFSHVEILEDLREIYNTLHHRSLE